MPSSIGFNFKEDLGGIGDDLLANRLFQDVSRDALAGLDLSLAGMFKAAGEVICEEGAVDHAMYLILSGSISISKRGRGGQPELLAILEAGEFFGEIALLEATERSATATSREDAILVTVDEESLRRLIMHEPQVGLNFARASMRRLRNLNDTFIHELMESERLNLIGTMVGSIVHDFKNPMGTIKQAVSLLRNRKEDGVLQEVAGYLEHAVDAMLDMTQELLDFSGGNTSVELKRVSVAELQYELDHLILYHLPPHIELSVDLQYEGDFQGDLSRMTRLLANIIKNAIEAMPDGGRVSLCSRVDGPELIFDIGDTGCGIPLELRDRIFEPFVTEGKSGGTGLGMAIAKSVVDAHHGRIWLDSVVGEGTTFHIAIPLTPES